MYSLEPPRPGGYNEYHNLCFEQKYENISFLSEFFFQFLEVKFSVFFFEEAVFRNDFVICEQ